MDSNNWRPAQTEGPPPIDGGDWRSQLQPDSRSRIVNKIMDTLKRHLPFSGQEGLQELKQIAIRFEEKIYSAATSQSDYLRKISLKMLTMESKTQAAPSNATGVSRNPQDSVPSQNMQSQLPSQSQSVSLQMASSQAQTRQQLLGQNMQSNNIASSGMQPTANLPNALPSSTMSQNALPNVPQNISGISQSSMGNTMNQGVASNMFSNAPRQQQMHGRQLTQQVGSQQHQQQSQNAQQLMYQQQLMKQKVQQAGNMQPLMQAQLQQQPPPSQPQQNLLQANQQPMMQTSSVMQPSMLPGLPQNQQSLQQPSQSVLQQHQQSAMRQQQQTQQSPIIQQQQTQAQQQSMMSSQAQHSQQQQQPLMGQQPNDANMQQSQLLGQQSNIPDMQQQQRLLGQQNNIQNLPNQQANHQNLQQQQQHMMGQQSNLSNMHQQQLGHQSHVGGLPQQQVMGTQSGSTNMQMNQHSLHMLQQPKASISQQGSLLQGGGQQAQPQLQSQQQLMSQLQSQPRQLQQQLGLQQSTNSLQQNMQPRMQNPNSLLQQQNIFDQQNKLLQAQRPHAEAPTTSLDSTAQTGGTSGGDWQEEVYQKIKIMKDMYFADLNDMYQKISIKLQQNESLPQGPKADQVDKLRLFKNMLEKLMQVLQTTKNNILPTHKEKLPSFEKQIISLLSSNRPRRPVPSMQSGQILPQMQSMQQLHQSHSQISQPQSHEVGVNPQLQSMNLQGSVAPMHQSNVPNLQHGSVPSLSAISASQQSMAGPGSLQNNSNLESGQGNTPSSMQQVPMTSLQQNSASALQQANITSLQSQTDASMLQPNINSHQSNSSTLQNQIMQNPQFKQQLQNRHLQQQLVHKQFQQQHVKQQQASQIAAHQMPQLHQTDVNEKMRQNLALRPGTFPQHLSSSQRFAHQQLKSGGASFPVSSPQLLQAVSPQISHPSPQIDQQTLQQSVVKSGTPLQSANSPFVPSPSTPLAPSPMPGDSEKPAVSSLSNAANVGNQHGGIPAATQSLSIGTPGISPSPLFECVGPEGNQGNSSAVSGKTSSTEQPLDRLLKAVNSISPKALEAAVCDIRSVVSMIDRIAGSAPGNGSRATVGEDLVALTKCRLQARNFLTQDGNTGTKRMRRYTSAMPLNDVTTVRSMNDSWMQLAVSETSELESPANSNKKRVKTEVNHALLEEIREINERLIDTVVDVSDEEMDPFIAASAHEGSEGTIVRCSYSAVSLSPDLKAHYSSAQVSQIQPLRLLVPINYPNCSPILLDKLPVDVSNEHEDLSVKAKSRFSISLRSLSQPMSLREIARTWDHCTRAVICEYAQKSGGGTFSSKYGTWEKCSSAA